MTWRILLSMLSLFLFFTVPVNAEKQDLPVELYHSGDDLIGLRLAKQLRLKIRNTPGLKLVIDANPRPSLVQNEYWMVGLETMEVDGGKNARTVVSWGLARFYDGERIYCGEQRLLATCYHRYSEYTRQLTVCGANVVSECAEKIATAISRMVELGERDARNVKMRRDRQEEDCRRYLQEERRSR
jgi:hypothetical protein